MDMSLRGYWNDPEGGNVFYCHFCHNSDMVKGKAWTDLEGSRKYSRYSFLLEAESIPGP